MLGKYSNKRLADLGRIDIPELLDTVEDTQETLEEITPAIKTVAQDYSAHISPMVNTVGTYWPAVLVGLAVVTGIGSAFGSWLVWRKR